MDRPKNPQQGDRPQQTPQKDKGQQTPQRPNQPPFDRRRQDSDE